MVYNNYRYIQQVPLFYTRPVISTTYHPVYDARLGRSNWTLDEGKIMQIKSVLNKYGFDCTTIGREIQPPIPKGKGFMDFEKQWATGGDCFISILTPRDRTINGNLALPPPWVVTESRLSYDSDRPHLVFVEEGVERAALYGEMDNMHIIPFYMDQDTLCIERSFSRKIKLFRSECETNQSKKTLVGVGQVVFVGLALFGGYKILEGFFDK
jgi:hypothetical protein